MAGLIFKKQISDIAHPSHSGLKKKPQIPQYSNIDPIMM
jgi:hypothetical protein